MVKRTPCKDMKPVQVGYEALYCPVFQMDRKTGFEPENLGSYPNGAAMNKCLKCDKETNNPKFCSRNCSSSYNNTGVTRHGEPRFCKVCNKKCYSECCSRNCRVIFNRSIKIEKWLSGQIIIESEDIPPYIKDYLLELSKYKCINCNIGYINPYTLKTILTVHHKDGNWKNNKIENLEILCPNCHALTENYGSRNKVNGGRENRKNWRKTRV